MSLWSRTRVQKHEGETLTTQDQMDWDREIIVEGIKRRTTIG